MALKYKLDAESFEELDESNQSNYRKEGNVYILDVDGLETGGEDLAGLKSKVEQLLTEKKEAERKAEIKSEEARRRADEKAKEAGDYEQLYKSQQAEAEQYKQRLQDLEQTVVRNTINAEAQRIASTLTKDADRGGLLAEKIASRLAHTDEGIKVTDDKGNLTVSSFDDLTNQVKTKYPFLVDGSQASGGAATGSKGGAGDSSKQVTRSEFEGMDQFKRSEFARSGGEVVDD